jgi:LAO/AO transport system kinase
MTSTPPQRRRSIAKALTLAANASVGDVLAMAPSSANACRRIGVTGPPGAGKSSLIASLARHRLAHAGDLAILAIDPTSPVSGGAILGDRIRMEDLVHNPRVYIRSLASRRSHDGLADNLPDMLAIIEAGGFAELIVETVGVGQVEYAVRQVVDTILLVLMPGAGDQIQAMKGGILETADIIVVNKSDQPGAQQLVAELSAVLGRGTSSSSTWLAPIISTSAKDAASIAALSSAIDQHQAWLHSVKGSRGVSNTRKAHHVGSLLARRVTEVLDALPPEDREQPLAQLYQTIVRHIADDLDGQDRRLAGDAPLHRLRGPLAR